LLIFSYFSKKTLREQNLTHEILRAAYKVHSALGPGLLESVYQECLFFELKQQGFHVEKEKPIPVIYEDIKMEVGYRMDLFVNKKVVIEIKSVRELIDLHMAQLITYLKVSNCKVGLLINFNVPSLKTGIRRVVND